MDRRRRRMVPRSSDPHGGQPILTRGPDPAVARATWVLVHGRGATAESILGLSDEFKVRDVAFVAPQAAGNTWYPYSFLAPMDENEPGLSPGLGALATVLSQLAEQGVDAQRVARVGFSQVAGLVPEHA